MSDILEFRFWGVRGSIPTPVQENLGVGGNTTCAELRVPDLPPVIFDCGTGIRALGLRLMREFPAGGECHIFFTHFHWDHVQGLPFFVPLFRPDWTIHFHSELEPGALEELLAKQMHGPFFPVEFAQTMSHRTFRKLPAGEVRLHGLALQHFPLRHPNGVCAYRITHGKSLLVFATDHEHGNRALDDGLIEHSTGADALIYDAQYTPAEYQTRHGWGHSTAEEGARMAHEAGVRQLVLFHHDPLHDDAAVARIAENAAAIFPGTIAASEGLTIRLEGRETELQPAFLRTAV